MLNWSKGQKKKRKIFYRENGVWFFETKEVGDGYLALESHRRVTLSGAVDEHGQKDLDQVVVLFDLVKAVLDQQSDQVNGQLFGLCGARVNSLGDRIGGQEFTVKKCDGQLRFCCLPWKELELLRFPPWRCS